MQHGGHSSDRDCGEHGPRQIGLGRICGAHHDGRDQYDGGYTERRELEAKAEGERRRRLFIGLIADAHVTFGIIGIHVGRRRTISIIWGFYVFMRTVTMSVS